MKKLLTMMAVIAVGACSARAGVEIVMQNTVEGGPAGGAYMSTMKIDGDNVRMDMKDPMGQGAAFIYSAAEQKTWNINHATRTYMIMDKQDVAKTAKVISDSLKQLEKQMATMPKEQREMMREMMGNIGAAGGVEAVVTVEKTGEEKTISGYPCVEYEVFRGGEKQTEIWATDWKNVGISKDDFNVFQSLTDFYGDMSKALQASTAQAIQMDPFETLEQIGGCPILVKGFDPTGATTETLFKSITEEELDPSVFDVPAGYKEEKIPMPDR